MQHFTYLAVWVKKKYPFHNLFWSFIYEEKLRDIHWCNLIFMQIVLYILQKVLDKNRMKQFTTNALLFHLSSMTWLEVSMGTKSPKVYDIIYNYIVQLNFVLYIRRIYVICRMQELFNCILDILSEMYSKGLNFAECYIYCGHSLTIFA